MQAGKVPEHFVRGGLADGYVKMSPYGPAVSDGARRNADAVKAEMLKGGYEIIKGPLKDNTGKVVVDKTYDNYDPYLDGMNWLLDGVQGSIT